MFIFDPVELTMKQYLDEVLDAPVCVSLPSDLPEKFVQVTRTGGPTGVVSDRALVTFLCWDTNRDKAARFAEDVRALVSECRSLAGKPVYRVGNVSGPIHRPDPHTGTDRYQFTAEISFRGYNAT